MYPSKDKFLLAHKFDDSDEYYVFVDEKNNKWEETYSPHVATTFPTAKAATSWSKNNTTFGEYAVALDKDKARAKFDAWVKDGMVRRKFDMVNKSLSRKYKNESPKEVLAWHISVRDDPDAIRYEDHETWPALYCVFKHLFDCKSYYQNDKCGKLWHSFSVRTPRDGKFEDFQKELDLILPHITLKDKKGGKIIDIFDHSLSAYGNSVCLIAHKNGKFSILGSCQDIRSDLKTCFEYLKRERYYE